MLPQDHDEHHEQWCSVHHHANAVIFPCNTKKHVCRNWFLESRSGSAKRRRDRRLRSFWRHEHLSMKMADRFQKLVELARSSLRGHPNESSRLRRPNRVIQVGENPVIGDRAFGSSMFQTRRKACASPLWSRFAAVVERERWQWCHTKNKYTP